MDSGGSAGAVAEGSVVSLPKGGGAIAGIGETFAADVQTGSASFTVPVTLPAGRAGVAPQLALAHSTGTGNGTFGLGWALRLPGVVRKTSRGVPLYDDGDTYILSGLEDLVPVSGTYPGRVRYRPRTEGSFARIEHVRDGTGDFWEVRGKDGMLTRHGTARPAGAGTEWRDPAVINRPGPSGAVFAWNITETVDPLGNRIRYSYLRDHGAGDGHGWDQPLIQRIEYADYGDPAAPTFLVAVEFEYEPRPDPFSDYRPGFEIRNTLRCRSIRVSTRAADGIVRVSREHRLTYQQASFNGVSLLTRIDVVGVDESVGSNRHTEALPPLRFTYSDFDPTGRRFDAVSGESLPPALTGPDLALVDLRGSGLPDIVELGAVHRYWTNRGSGRFDPPRSMSEAPPRALSDPAVQFLDANGDGRTDLLVAAGGGGLAGYFPLDFAGRWDQDSFRPYRQMPSVDLADPAVRLIDLDGDGLTDILRSGSRLECWFNDPDPREAWKRTALVNGPAVDLADPRVRLADMTGDGLQDIVLVRSGNVSYWPNLGHGRWGEPVRMRRSPRLPVDHDPRRVLLGDIDGDGAADLVYVDHGRVHLWGNRSGDGWTEQPVTINGTPALVDTDEVQLVDLYGTGMAGLLWNRVGSGPSQVRFLDFCGGVKPYLLSAMDNSRGSRTTVRYRSSTYDFLRDRATGETRWRTTLPFPVQVVASVEAYDQISLSRLVTEYRYHHGYWDGEEREFRGFAMVEQLDTETVSPSTLPSALDAGEHHSPPTLTRSWFQVGPVAAVAADDWVELDLSHEYWDGDPPMLTRPAEMTAFLRGLSRGDHRDALRALSGQLVRSELYALDGGEREDRPYTVTEALSGLREESPPAPEQDGRRRIFFPFEIGSRTTQWERGAEPMTGLSFSAGYDAYGFATQQLTIAVPRGRDPRVGVSGPAQPYLSTYSTTEHARRDDASVYLVDRVCRATEFEVRNDGRQSVFELRDAVFGGTAELRLIGHGRTFFDGPEFVGLPLGELGEFGLPTRSESLAFTDGFLTELGRTPPYLSTGTVPWSTEYPQEFRELTPALAGYVHYDDADVPGSPNGYYRVGNRQRYDFHDPDRVPRGLVLASRDASGAESRIEYDEHDLFPVRTTNPIGLTSEASYDYRVLTAREVTDANGNTSSVTFSPAGFVTASFVRGKHGEGVGDLVAPSARMEYDLDAFTRERQPVSVRSIRRVHHDSAADIPGDIPAGERDDVIVTVEYSDGFGRLLQTRTQAEDTRFGDALFGGGVLPVDQAAPVGPAVGRTRKAGQPDNVVVSGWQIYDNKGRVVEKYEPFFDTGFDYVPLAEAQLGQKAVMFYEPRGQLIRTVAPDGSEQRVVIGVPADLTDPDVFAPTPWESYTYDANDNAGRTHGTAAAAYDTHWNTPASVEVDALGRVIRTVARNGADPAKDWITTRTTYDVQGNLLGITDPLGRVAFQYRYDLTGRQWRSDSIDAGRRDAVHDGLDRVLEIRDAKGAVTLHGFDVVGRPIRVWARDSAVGSMTLRQRIEYGDDGDPDQPAADRAAARAQNLLGQAVRHYDEAGLRAVTGVDFKGNVLESTQRVIADAPLLATYAQAANAWQVPAFRVDWEPGPRQSRAQREAELLEPAGYPTSTRFDALNRATRQVLPVDADGERPVFQLSYNRGGGLERVLLDGTVHVERIAYDAKGQRTLIAYGNGMMIRYAYDKQTFRLTRLRTERYVRTDLTYQPAGQPLQDCGHDYDLAGNLLRIRDRTPGCGLPARPDVLDRTFTYDPTYRLKSATGRETDLLRTAPWDAGPRGVDITRTRAYTENYTYNHAGTLLRLHHSSAGGFTRDFVITTPSNRMHRMQEGATAFDYTYDANGNLLTETTSRHFTWNHLDQLVTFGVRTAGAEPSVHAHYLYDASGQRVKKLVRRQGGAVEVTHYVGDFFEHHRWGSGAAEQNNHIHVMDDQQRIALVRIGPAAPGDQSPAVAFQFGDHLGSSTVTVDDTGAVVNREEYTPYGETSFGSYARKRYRFTGKERDEESGLNYHGARYCLAWLARWASCDPIGATGGLNQYTYAACNPVTYHDPAGTNPKAPANDPSDVAQFEAREAAFEAGKKLEKGETKATSNGKELPPPTGKQLDKMKGNSKKAKKLRLKYATSQGVEAGQVLKRNVTDRSAAASVRSKDVPNFGDASAKLVPEVGFHKGRVISVGKNPGGEPKGARTADLAIAKQATKPEDWDALKGQRGDAAFDAAQDMKLGEGKVPKKDQFRRAAGGLDVTELRPNTKLRRPKMGLGGVFGKIAAVFAGGYVAVSSGDAWAGVQTANPLANATDELISDDRSVGGTVKALAKDAWDMTPGGMYTDGLMAGGELLKMSVDCASIGLGYYMGEIPADDLDVAYCMPFFDQKIQQEIYRELGL